MSSSERQIAATPDRLTDRPDLSVVVLTHNSKKLLEACLQSIKTFTHSIDLEIIVVDNRSTDGTGEFVKTNYPDVIYHYRDEPFSFTRSNNEGVAKSSGRYVLLLNDDTELRNDAFDRIVEYFDAHPDVGIIGPKLFNADGSIQYSCRHFPSFTTALFNRYSFLTRFFPANPFSKNYLLTDWKHDETRPIDWVSGAAIAARRTAFEKVGLLDEGIISFTEDVDWCYRMHEAGWKVVFLHEAEIMHYIGIGKKHHPWRFIYIQHRSILYFYFKHYSKSILFIDAAVTAGVVLRALAQGIRQSLQRA